jgi:Domain of unknown function (DUF4157)
MRPSEVPVIGAEDRSRWDLVAGPVGTWPSAVGRVINDRSPGRPLGAPFRDPMPARSADLLNGGLQRRVGPGMPMSVSLRAEAESRFGADFGDVRIHDNPAAHHLAREQSARAFTIGRDIIFNEGRYRPGSQPGRLLLAHELAHVVQQHAATGGLAADPAHEVAAESAAQAVLGGSGPVNVGPLAAVGVQRQPELPTATTSSAGPDMAEATAEINAELAELWPLVISLAADVLVNPEDHALNQVRGTAMRLEGDVQVVSQLASRADAPPTIASAAARFQTMRTTLAPVVAAAERWHNDHPAGESLGMWNERQGTRLGRVP